MDEVEFDRAFSEFLNFGECEKVNEAVFQLMRASFVAGWKAALDSDIRKSEKTDKG